MILETIRQETEDDEITASPLFPVLGRLFWLKMAIFASYFRFGASLSGLSLSTSGYLVTLRGQ